MSEESAPFPPPGDRDALERGAALTPRFNADGLMTAVAVDAASGEVLMVAHMNAEALAATLATGTAHYYSRSRGRLWMKGESSGQVQTVEEIRVDCDQDALVLRVRVGGDGNSCHTGARTCFYRRVATAPDGTPRLVPAAD